MRKIGRLFSEGYLLDVGVIRDFMRENIGDITFQVIQSILHKRNFYRKHMIELVGSLI